MKRKRIPPEIRKKIMVLYAALLRNGLNGWTVQNGYWTGREISVQQLMKLSRLRVFQAGKFSSGKMMFLNEVYKELRQFEKHADF